METMEICLDVPLTQACLYSAGSLWYHLHNPPEGNIKTARTFAFAQSPVSYSHTLLYLNSGTLITGGILCTLHFHLRSDTVEVGKLVDPLLTH